MSRCFGNNRCCGHRGNNTRTAATLATMARHGECFGLISLLEDLRDAYELAKENQHPTLQSRLMDARRTLVALLQQNLNLHDEILDLQQQLAGSRAEIARLHLSQEEPRLADPPPDSDAPEAL